MADLFQSRLAKHRLKHLAEVKRCVERTSTIAGYIVDFSDSLILFHSLDWDTFQLNGYKVIRNDDVRQYRFFNKVEYWQFRAAKLARLQPVAPQDISLASLPELFASVSKHFPLIAISREKTRRGEFFVGSLVSMTNKTFTIEDLDYNAKWSGRYRIRFSEVTRIDFGGGYERALNATAPPRPKRNR